MAVSALPFAGAAGSDIAHPQKIATISKSALKTAIKTEGLITTTKITGIDTFRDRLQENYPTYTDYEIASQILLSLGNSEERIASLPEDRVLEALDYQELVRTETYYRQYDDGCFEISKDQYAYDKIRFETFSANSTLSNSNALVKNSALAVVSASALPNFVEKFGSIRLWSSAYKRSASPSLPNRNRYTITGDVEWVGSPNFKFTDVLAIYSDGNIDNAFTHCGLAIYENDSGSTHAETDDFNMTGQYLTVFAPSTHALALNLPLHCGPPQNPYIIKSAYLDYGVTAQSDITCQVAYCHKTLAIGGISVGVSASGLSFSVPLGIGKQDFFGKPFTLYYP